MWVVIKGVAWEGDKDVKKGKIWAQKFLKEKLDVDCEIINWRLSGPAIIIRMGSIENKWEVMINKYKLKGGNIFLENDLSYDEESKVQEKINR